MRLIGLNRSSFYYKSSENLRQNAIKTQITQIFEEIPIYGAAKVHQQLLEDGFKISLNTVANYRQKLGLKAVLAVRQVNTTVPIKEHKKYSYKLRGLISGKPIRFGVLILPTLKLMEEWYTLLPLLIGTQKQCSHIRYQIPWIVH